MGKVVYATGIDYVSGALSKPVKKNGHSCGTYLIGKHRTAATTNPNCTTLFVQNADTYDRSTAPTPTEIFNRQRFAAVRAAVKERSEDLTKVDADQAAFIAQKDTAGGKKTMNSYLWSLEIAKYDEQHPRG